MPPNANRVSPIEQEAPASWAAAGDAFDLGIAQVESVRQASVILRPEGRFGADSRSRRELSTCAELGFDYGFVDCGTGVVNLVIRPHAGPFDAEVRAVVTPLTDRLERPKDAATETTPFLHGGVDRVRGVRPLGAALRQPGGRHPEGAIGGPERVEFRRSI